MTTAAITAARCAADYACTHGQLAREVVSLQAATQFGDTTTAARLTELKGLVEGPRVDAAVAYAVALAAGDGDALRAASADFEAMGDMLAAADASAHAPRIAAECGGAVSPALREATEPHPFTAREREVVSLVAQGLSNRQIAETLGRSIRTVGGHIYQASRRSGAKDRTELAAFIRELGSSPRG